MSCFRHCTSGKRKRYIDQKYDLDLSFITPTIIASGCPVFGAESCFRNPAHQMESFLNERFSCNYFVFNLCSEENRWYSGLFGDRVFHYPHPDHYAPPIELVVQFVQKAAWILDQPNHPAIVVHCKAGKGRSGLMICCLLLYLAHVNGVSLTVEDALGLFAKERGRRVKFPSQIRVITLYQKLLKAQVNSLEPVKPTLTSKSVRKLTVYSLLNHYLTVKVLCSKGVFDCKTALKLARYSVFAEENCDFRTTLRTFDVQSNHPKEIELEIFGEVLVEIYAKKEMCARIQFFVGEEAVVFKKSDFDAPKSIVGLRME
ncbi:4 [Hexamita inflata]|uniref:phosphatidylinositol-3,4,5-trisphosphate 3-phosphatase n=1 Tax=Hexamita inflata TaxID=28002 RepID=A0AA86NGN0_9EUKA|nr:4 [Hexamita inflata] [Hexamita inflata]